MNNNNKINDQDNLNILRKIKSKPNATQRLAKDLGLSLGKLNCLNALIAKGLIKIKNFKKNPKKISYAYILTQKE